MAPKVGARPHFHMRRIGAPTGVACVAALILALWNAASTYADSFATCPGQAKLIRPGWTDAIDPYWWDGKTLKTMNGWGCELYLHQATSFEEMHNPAPKGGLVREQWMWEAGGSTHDVWTLGANKGTFRIKLDLRGGGCPNEQIGNVWQSAVFKDLEGPNTYFLYHTESADVGKSCPGDSSASFLSTGLAVSADGGLNWSDRGLIFDSIVGPTCPRPPGTLYVGGIFTPAQVLEDGFYYIFFSNNSGGTATDPVNQGEIVARISVTDLRLPDAVQRIRFYNGAVAGGQWNISTRTGQVCASSDPGTCAGKNVFVSNVHPIPTPGGRTSWRKGGTWDPPTPFVPIAHWNGTLGRYVMLVKEFSAHPLYDRAVIGPPSLLYHAGVTLESDPLNWKPFAAYRRANGTLVTASSNATGRSYLLGPGPEAFGYYYNLVSPYDGTDKLVSAGHDMRLFSPPGNGQGAPESNIAVKFSASDTPPSCSDPEYDGSVPEHPPDSSTGGNAGTADRNTTEALLPAFHDARGEHAATDPVATPPKGCGCRLGGEQQPAALSLILLVPFLGAALLRYRRKLKRLMANPRLSSNDRKRLDLHLGSVRELEVSLACRLTSEEEMALDRASNSDGIAVLQTARLHMDVVALAVACGYTRSAAIQVGSGNDRTSGYKNLETGQPIPAPYHSLSHRTDVEDNSAPRIEGTAMLHHYIDRQFAQTFKHLLDRLSAYKMPDGTTLLDHGLSVWFNDNGVGLAHTIKNVPWIIAGSAGGFLKQGQCIEVGGDPNLSQLLNTLGAAVGAKNAAGTGPLDDFGDLSVMPRGRLPEITA